MRRMFGVLLMCMFLLVGLGGCQSATSGKDGAAILSGEGAPASTLGKVGDFFLDKTASVLYGPKTDVGWGSGLALIGGAGPTGPAGPEGPAAKTVLSGAGAPAAALGQNGDFYLDTTNRRMYGPKTAGAWGAGFALVGPAGGPGNVIYSNWATLAQAWTDFTIDGSANKANFITSGAVSANIVNSGTVMVYMRVPGDLQANGLPYTSNAGGTANTMWFTVETGKINLYRFTHNNSGSIGVSSSLLFKFVLIPGGVLASSMSMNLDLTDYEQVKKAYNLPD